MKKFLEVLMDENGQLHISTDFTFADEIENPPKDKKKHAKEMDELFRKTISSGETITFISPRPSVIFRWQKSLHAPNRTTMPKSYGAP